MLNIRTQRSWGRAGIIAGGMLVVMVLALSYIVRTDAAQASTYSWETGTITGQKDTTRTQYAAYGECTYQTVTIYSGSWPGSYTRDVCLFTAKSYRYTIYDSMLYVSVGSDQKMYRVNASFSSYNYVVPSPETNQFIFSSLVTKDLLSKLTLVQSGSNIYYEQSEDFWYNLAIDEQGTSHGFNGRVISHNGKWMLANAQGIGLVRFNLDDFTATRISPPPPGFPSLAISNDGNYVTVTNWGNDYQLTVYDIENCGQSASTLQSSWVNASVPESCTTTRVLSDEINAALGTTYSRTVDPADFSDDGGQLTFYTSAQGANTPVQVTLNAGGYVVPQKLDYLALGDSISSGEGDTAKTIVPKGSTSCNGSGDIASEGYVCKYYRTHTDVTGNYFSGQPREKCHLSTRSYPYKLAAWMGLARNNDPKEWDSVACSGAKTTDIYGGDSSYDGQARGGLLFGDTPRLDGIYNKDELQTTALNETIPGRVEQIKFVEKYHPKAITLTAGANDVEFSDKLQSCLRYPTTCDWATSKREDLAKQIQGEYSRLVSLYNKLQQVSPQTKIYVLGYPRIISGNQPASCGRNIGLLDDTERAMIVDATNYFNLVIERAANAAGVKYVDISDSLSGGKLCDDGQKYVTGIAVAGTSETQESFHPNSQGQAKIAQAVKTAMGNVEKLNCGASITLVTCDVCPDTSAANDVDCPKSGEAIEKPPVTNFNGVLTDSQKQSQYEAVMNSVVAKGSTQTITLDKYSHKPESLLDGSIRSDPVDIGEFVVAGDGGLSQTITIPSTIPAGYHTLILTGETYSGEPIETTQTILVTGTDPTDLDDNGTTDSQQPCGAFMVASNQDADLDGIDDACDPEISSSPQLYRVRTGDISRQYNGTAEHQDYLYIERNTRASSITGVVGDDDPDSDNWAIVGVSQGIPYSTTTIPDTAPAANFEVAGEGVNAKPYVYIRAGGYGCVSFTPTSLATVQSGQPRSIKKVAYNTGNCRQEPPEDDVDANGQPDNTQALYEAHQGNQAKGEDPARIYLSRNFYASEAQLGISDYTPTGTPAGSPSQPIQEWNLLASSKPGEYVPAFNKLVILSDSNNNPLPTILTKKQNGQCIAYQPENTEIIKMTTQSTRYLKKLTGLPGGVGCE